MTDNPAAALAAKRLRWKSRRGWLELDLLLAEFWRRHGDALTPEEEALLAQWLEMDDDHLWALLKTPPAAGGALAAKIRPTTPTISNQKET